MRNDMSGKSFITKNTLPDVVSISSNYQYFFQVKKKKNYTRVTRCAESFYNGTRFERSVSFE
jgi:hypothetical protein